MKNILLDGCTVVDVSHHMAGPVASQRLGDMGAEVIKIEPLGYGEWSRVRPIGNAWVGNMNASFLSGNRNKKSLTLNLKTKQGKEIFDRLIEKADVFLSNFRPNVHMRLGIDYETLSSRNPGLIYCTITGYGNDGPYAEKPGQDLLIQALSGVTWNMGTEDDPPIPLGTFVADAAAGYNAVAGILAALYYREHTGLGQQVAVDLLSSLIEVQTQEYTTYLNSGQLPLRSKERLGHPLVNSPYGIHKTKDGYLALAMVPFDRLAEVLECEGLKKYQTWEDGQLCRDEIFRLVGKILAGKTTREWLEYLDAKGIWCSPVKTYPEVVEDPQVIHMNVFQKMRHPQYGEIGIVANPIRFGRTPVAYRNAPPQLGEHNVEILSALGYTGEQISCMEKNHVIQNPEHAPENFKI